MYYPTPPSVELHTTREQQWFPRPITDTIESSLDHLERVEEDRRRRLRSIANVAARVPIGIGGTEDRGNGGAGTTAANVSPKPNKPGNYGRYRYYPPPEETPANESISLHRSYTTTATPASSFSPLVTGRSRDRRRNNTAAASAAAQHSRRAGGASASRNRSRSTSHSPHSQRRDLHTPTDFQSSAAAAQPTVHMDHNNGSTTSNNSDNSGSSSIIEGGRFLDSFNVSTSAVLFLSPPFDPRAGGGQRGGRRSSIGSTTPSMNNSMMHLYQHSSVDWSMSTPHHTTTTLMNSSSVSSSRQQQQQQQLQVDTTVEASSSTMMMMDDADLITPPAMATSSSTTPAEHASAQHGRGEDVYSQRSVRRSQRQRRRRRDWE